MLDNRYPFLDGSNKLTEGNIFISDLEQIKGFEFDIVIIINCNKTILPPDDIPKEEWCRLRDLNSRPTDYKSVALPTELKRHKKSNYIKIIFFQPNFVEAQMVVRLQHCSH